MTEPIANPELLLQEKLRALEARFVLGLAEKFDLMQTSLDKISQNFVDVQASELQHLHRQLHTLAGSAGTFGFALLGQKASQLECRLNELLEPGAASAERWQQFTQQLQSMLEWARINPKDGESTAPLEQQAELPVVNMSTNQETEATRLVYVLDDDILLGKEIAVQLEYFGYQVEIVTELSALAGKIAQKQPAAVVIELGFPAGGMAGAREVARISEVMKICLPTIFISKDGGFAARLAAVRAGADSYFTKPVDVVALTDRLDVLTLHRQKAPYRILIVDDDACSAEYYAALLEKAGMEVRLLHEPAQILQQMAEYRPELVLLDVYMPDCSGIELARLLRQDNLYLDTPIVFLSTERNYGKQLLAVESGADDFLTKPIRPAHLLSSLSSRVERYRLLRDLIMRDSLTGLYKHSTIKELLEREVVRAQRQQRPLTVAMLDIDHFKRVNDEHGHQCGDHVIRTLSRLLQQRLRRVDIIGRYGGEEFIVIFPDTPQQLAYQMLERIRQAFFSIKHYALQSYFSVSFSAGIIEAEIQDDCKSLLAAADAALYAAKGSGRNQIKIFGQN